MKGIVPRKLIQLSTHLGLASRFVFNGVIYFETTWWYAKVILYATRPGKTNEFPPAKLMVERYISFSLTMVPSGGTCWFSRCFLVDGTSTRNLNETKTHFQRSSLWLTGRWLGRDITLHLNSYLISCAFMFDIVYGYVLYTWCLVSCVVHLISHNLCFIVGMYIS